MFAVTGNILWFYAQGDRRRHVSPDLMVCFGIPKGDRNNYLMWEEGCVPQVVFEFTSASTLANDLGPKRERYEALGVEEYYLFDPREKPLAPRFRTFHRQNGRFVPVVGDVILSNRLGLEIIVVDGTLRFRSPVTSEILPTAPERQAQEAELRRQESARAEREAARAEQEAARAGREAARADQEAALRQEAERQLAELKRQMKQLRHDQR